MIRPLLLDTGAHDGNSDEVKAVFSSRLLAPQSWKRLQKKLGAAARWREIKAPLCIDSAKDLRSAAEPVSKPRKLLPRRTNMHEKVPAVMTTTDFTSAAKRESHSR